MKKKYLTRTEVWGVFLLLLYVPLALAASMKMPQANNASYYEGIKNPNLLATDQYANDVGSEVRSQIENYDESVIAEVLEESVEDGEDAAKESTEDTIEELEEKILRKQLSFEEARQIIVQKAVEAGEKASVESAINEIVDITEDDGGLSETTILSILEIARDAGRKISRDIAAEEIIVFEEDFSDETEVVVELSGEEEVPAVETNGSGKVMIKLFGNLFILDGDFEDLEGRLTDSPAHIHRAAFGLDGPIVYPIEVNANQDMKSGKLHLEKELTDLEVQELIDGLWYVNVHSSAYPEGEIRGQIILVEDFLEYEDDDSTDSEYGTSVIEAEDNDEDEDYDEDEDEEDEDEEK